MKRLILLLLALVAAGCTRGYELSERAFVLGVAIDLSADRSILLTTQVYNPNQGKEDNPAKGSSLNVSTKGESVFEAIRDITLQLGRKGQWSHIQMILIGEEVAKSPRFQEVLDFFYRDDEPRLINHITITEGRAEDYLQGKSQIENSIGRTMLDIQHSATKYTSKIPEITLRELVLGVQSEVSTAVVPYAVHSKNDDKRFRYAGGAVIRNKRMTGVLPTDEIQYYLMMVNKFKNGVITIPTGPQSTSESFEILSSETHIKPLTSKDPITVKISVKMSGSIREVTRSVLDTPETTRAYEKKIGEAVQARMEKTLQNLKVLQADALGVGNRISKQRPGLWKELKPDWKDHYEKLKYEFDVKVTILNTGLETGRAIFSQ